MRIRAIKKQTHFPKWPKMNVNLYVIEDYENETALQAKKTNPIQTQSKPVLSAVEWVEWFLNKYKKSSIVNHKLGVKTSKII